MTTPAASPASSTPAEGTPPEGTPPEGTPPEGTPPEGTPPEGTPPAEGTPAPSGAPESYQPFEISKEFEIDETQHKSISEYFKEKNLTQADAQGHVAFFEKTVSEMAEKAHKDDVKARETWASEVQADKELGGDTFKENLAIANKTINSIGDPAKDKDGNPILDKMGKPMTTLGMFLAKTGLGNHPEMVRFAYRVGKLLSPDSLDGAGGGAAPVVEKTPGEILFPEQGKK